MTDRIDGIWGLRADKDGRVRGNLRKGEQGILIEEILPHAGRGDGFADLKANLGGDLGGLDLK
ncbi:hypothetical protein [Halocynthiibacter sp.]|uniref:hypothetical protein n=1 Tax=Halocynthiibacter sp. TaxID=1979210 RepID=UPI003C38F828